MTIIQLEYIIALDTFRHFATAAEHCFVTQPTLSMQIQKLEEELDIKIFDRSKQPVIPTEIGEEIIAQARTILKESKRIKELIHTKKEIKSGELRLGIIPTLAPYLLPLFLQNFLKKYPLIKVKITEMTTDDLLEKLKKNVIDVGLLITPTNDDNINEYPLFYEKFVVFASKLNKIYKKKFVLAKDIDVNSLWLLEEGHCFRSQIMNICELRKARTYELNCEYEVGSIETLKKIVQTNNGMTILPELATYDLTEEQQKMVRQFKAPAPVREVSLVTHRSYLKKQIIDLLIDEILAVIPLEMKEIKRKNIVGIK